MRKKKKKLLFSVVAVTVAVTGTTGIFILANQKSNALDQFFSLFRDRNDTEIVIDNKEEIKPLEKEYTFAYIPKRKNSLTLPYNKERRKLAFDSLIREMKFIADNPLLQLEFLRDSGNTLQMNELFSGDIFDDPLFDETYEYYVFRDQGMVLSGIVLNHSNADIAREIMQKNEPKLFESSLFLYLGLALPQQEIVFENGSYRDYIVRYFNVPEENPLSLDYIVTSDKIILATSQNTLHMIVDHLYPPIEETVQPISLVRKRIAFDQVEISPDDILTGPGENIDAPVFWADSKGANLKLYVSAKTNDLVEVWRAPFRGKSVTTHKLPYTPNGMTLDHGTDELYIADTDDRKIRSYKIPSLTKFSTFGDKKIDEGENNVALLQQRNGSKIIYVTEDRAVLGFDLASKKQIYKIKPNVTEIEEILTDPYYQMLFVPDEQGSESKKYAGGAIEMYHPNGTVYTRGGKHVIGQGKFAGDAEGTALYKCMGEFGDTGDGLLIFADQVFGEGNKFLLFDRRSLAYYGAFSLKGVTGTDGIDLYQEPTAEYPRGVFAAVNNDTSTAVIDWGKILDATDLDCYIAIK